MQGTIGVESTPGQGSIFWFVVPCENVTDLRSDPKIAKPWQELRNVRILIVDREPLARQILDCYLLAWGMRTSVVSSPDEALKVLRQAKTEADPFKIALIDYGLQEKNGIDLAKEIFADAKLSDTKLILVTAADSPGLGERAIEVGFNAYVTKPVRQSTMLESITSALSGGQPIISRSAADARARLPAYKVPRHELILVAEDYPINQQVAQLYLDELGFASHIVSNGKEAVDALARGSYALVLMDCQMPEMDGYAASRAIREAETLTGKNVPIVAMTAHAMGGDRENCLAAGMDDYLTKPVEPEELRKIIEKWLPLPAEPVTQLIQERRRATDHETMNAPLDLKALHSRYGLSAERLIALFFEDAPPLLDKIQKAYAAGDNKELAVSTHSLKGLCGTVCAPPMRQLCADIENSMKNNDGQSLLILMDKLNSALPELRQYFENSK
jgi:CheY-like chemotaxis protein